MKKIALRGKYGEGKFALVSDVDYEMLSKFSWYSNPGGYAMGCVEGKAISMHRLIVGLESIPKGHHVDHVNRDRLDNRRCNLRVVTPHENVLNSHGPFNPEYTPTPEDRERWRLKGAETRKARRVWREARAEKVKRVPTRRELRASAKAEKKLALEAAELLQQQARTERWEKFCESWGFSHR